MARIFQSGSIFAWPDNDAYDGGNTLTVAFWFLPNTTGNAVMGIVNKRANFTSGSWSMGTNYNSQSGIFSFQNNSQSGDSSQSGQEYEWSMSGWSTTVWQHIAVCANLTLASGQKVSGFRNAVTLSFGSSGVRTDSGNSQFANGTNALVLGRVNSTGGFYYSGALAEVGVWNVVLSIDELTALLDGWCPSDVRPSALVFHAPLFGADAEPNIALRVDSSTSGATPTVTDHPPAIIDWGWHHRRT